MTRLSFIPAQFVKVVQATRPDLAQYVVAGIYIKDGAAGVARAWKVNADGSDGGEIEFVNEGGKDDTVSAAILPDGSVRLVVSEAVPGGSGTTAQPSVYLVPGVFPPQSSIVAGGGLVVPPQGELWAFAQAPWVGEQAIPLGALIPPSSSVMVRLVVSGAPGRMARLNNGALEGICQVAGVRSTIQGEVALDAAQTLHLSVAQELSECHVQIIGWR